MIPAPFSYELVSQSQIAERMNLPATTVNMWYTRRAKNGFPEPVACHIGRSCRRGPLFDLHEVEAWYASYDPRYSGKNALRRKKTIEFEQLSPLFTRSA